MACNAIQLLLLASSALAIRPQNVPRTMDAGHIIGRQEASATFTLGPRDGYIQAPTSAATPTGDQILIVPSSLNEVPKGGIDLFFGPDIAASVRTSLDEDCADGANDQCIVGLAGALNQGRSYELEARVVGIDDIAIALAALVGVMGYIIEVHRLGNDGAAPTHLHMPASDLQQIQSHSGSDIPVVPTAGGDVITIPATIPTTAPPGPTTASIYIYEAGPGQGHGDGQYVLAMPDETASLMEDLLRRTGACPNNDVRKRQSDGIIDYSRVYNAGAFVLPMAAPGQLLDALGLVAGQRLPQLVNEAARDSWSALRVEADTLLEFAGVPPEFRDTITSGVWAMAFQWCIEGLNDAAQIFFEDSLWSEDLDEEGDGNSRCPDDAPTGIDAPDCEDPQCVGRQGMCRGGKWNHCNCLQAVPYDTYPGGLTLWESQQYVLQGMLTEHAPTCSDDDVVLDRSVFDEFVELWCSDIDLSSDTSKSLTIDDIGGTGYEGTALEFAWTETLDQKEPCSATCQEIFHSFGSVSECAYDSHTFAKSGRQELTCGTGTFNIVEDAFPVPNPDAPYAEGRCKMDVQLDAWSGDVDKLLPFWMKISSMQDANDQSLEPTDKWVQSGAASPMTTTSKLEAVLELIPIKASGSDIPYIEFNLGEQSWRSDTERLDSGAYPGCNLVPCTLCDNPKSFYYYCEYECWWGGGASSNA